MQVFHAIWLVDEHGNHPAPYTLVSAEDVESGRWRINTAVAEALGIDVDYAEATSPTTRGGSPRAGSTT